MKYLKEEYYSNEYKERLRILEFYRILANKIKQKKYKIPSLLYSEEWFKRNAKDEQNFKNVIPEQYKDIRDMIVLRSKLLYEGLIKTFSKDETISILNSYGYGSMTEEEYRISKEDRKKKILNGEDIKDIDILYNQKYNMFSFFLDLYDFVIDERAEKLIIQTIERLIMLMSNLGWYVSIIIGKNDKKEPIQKTFREFNKEIFHNDLRIFDSIQINFQAKFTQELDLDQYPEYGYHVTTNLFINKILKIGLVPKTKSKIGNHPSRIYMAQTINDAKKLLFQLVDEKNESIRKAYILKINLNDFGGLLFVDDMASKKIDYEKDCIWTNNNISPNRITIEEKIKINE